MSKRLSQPAAYFVQFLKVIELFGLGIITLATIWAAGEDIGQMMHQGHVSLGDLLMLFLYLEVFAMVGIYITSGQLPVRLPIYIAIVAIARYMVLEMKEISPLDMLLLSLTLLVLVAAVLAHRYGRKIYAYEDRPLFASRSLDLSKPQVSEAEKERQ